MHNAYRRGAADTWYSGFAGDLWVEYKFVRKLPVRAPLRIYKLLEPLQLRWLNARYDEGRHVAVVLGVEAYAYIFEDRAWNSTDVTRANIVERGYDRKDVADYIRRKTMPT